MCIWIINDFSLHNCRILGFFMVTCNEFIIKLFLDNGIDVNYESFFDANVLHFSATASHVNITKTVIENQGYRHQQSG